MISRFLWTYKLSYLFSTHQNLIILHITQYSVTLELILNNPNKELVEINARKTSL